MAVRAADRVTLAVLPAVTYARTYYQLRASNLSVPPVPTTNPPPAPWTETEPAFSESSTDTLYTVALTVYGTAGYEYGPVQVSSSYEAAKSAYNKAVSVLTIAAGKNTINFSATTPPSTGNADRVAGDIWWQRSGTVIIGQWMWTGSAWALSPLRDEVIANLSVGKLVAGSGTINTLVSEKIWTEAVVAHLIEAERIITGEALIDGAVTARTLNIVHTDPTSGYSFILEPAGLTIMDNEGNPVISLRADMSNYFSVMKDGVSVASISPDGDITGRELAANEALYYRTEELSEILAQFPRGVIAKSTNYGTNSIVVGTDEARAAACTFRTPSSDRMVSVSYRGRISTGSARKILITLRQSTGNFVKPTNSGIRTWYEGTNWNQSWDYTITQSVTDWGWPLDETITVGFFVASQVSGELLTIHHVGYQDIIVSDDGPAVETQVHTPWAPATGGGGGTGNETAPAPREYTPSWDATSHKTYSRSSTVHTRAGKSLVQGYIAGVTSRGHWIFPASTIRSAISGSTSLSGSLTIRNEHTYSSSGMTAVLKVHNYSTAPSTFGTTTTWTSVSVPRGRDVTIKLPTWILDGLKANTIKGFSLDSGTSTSSTYYGYFSPKATLSFKYKK